jgi:ABC-2 type transport system permease protein
MNSKIIWSIFKKDLIEAIRDRYILISMLFPLAFSLLFGLLSSPNNDKIIITLYSPDHSQVIRQQLQAFPRIQVFEVASVDELTNTIEQKKTAGGLVLPKGYDSAFKQGNTIEITAYLNQQASISERTIFQQAVNGIELSSIQQPIPVHAKWIDLSGDVNEQNKFNFTHWIFAIALLFSLSTVGGLVVPLLLVIEKEKHTLDFLLVSPANSMEIVFAKALTGLTYCALMSLILIVTNHEMITNIPVLAFVILLGTILIVLIGLMLGTFFQNSTQVNTWASLVLVILLVPGFGTMFQLPAILETGLHIIPTFYLMDALNITLAGNNLISIWVDIAILFGSIAAVFALVAWSLQRRSNG